MLKALILFKKEDILTSKILDCDYENDEEHSLIYTYEKFA